MGLTRQIEHHEAWKVIEELKQHHGSYAAIPSRLAGDHTLHLSIAVEQEQAERRAARREAAKAPAKPDFSLKPLSFDERSGNELRPTTFDQLVGQDRLKTLMRRIVARAIATGQPLDHMLIIGTSGSGKTTFAQIVANELGRTVYQVEAPVRMEVLEWLSKHGRDGDVLIIDECHMIAKGAGRSNSGEFADPETFYLASEDRRLPVDGKMITFPKVTFIGATTDAGLLPEALVNRFPFKITLDRYSWEDMARLATANAFSLNMAIGDVAAEALARASRRSPRLVNSYVKNALSLIGPLGQPGCGLLTADVADEVVESLNATTWDGLDSSQQRMLIALLHSKRQDRMGEFVYQASIGAITTALGLGRDARYVSITVEPYLIAEGLVAITHGGRTLTEAGIKRAQELSHG